MTQAINVVTPIVEDLDLDLGEMSKLLDKVKSKVFLSKSNAAFLGTLMCSLNFNWSRDIPTAGTDGINLWWNPDYFNSLPSEGTANALTCSRATNLNHELWHVALLHNMRRGSRNQEIWNIACDIKIDLMLEAEGYSFKGVNGVPRDPKYKGWVEEDIYEDLINNNPPPPNSSCTCCSMALPETDKNIQAVVNTVVMAVHQAKLSGQAGNLPGEIEQTLKKFLEPVIPWQQVLMKWFTDMLDEDYSWHRPNRRYDEMYLPSKFEDEGRLAHLVFYEDVSGSITDAQHLRFNSEVKYIQEVLKPKRLTLCQFDVEITDEKDYKEEDPFDEIKIIGGGGTSYHDVRRHIIEHKPTAAVIFSDMYCAPMQPLPFDIPIIWIAINNPGATPPFGKMLHIRS